GLGLAGCPGGGGSGGAAAGKAGGEGGAAGSGEVVARVGDVTITLAEFEDQLNQQNPLIRARYNSLEQKKKLLDSLVEREAMVLEARRLGLEQDPDMQRGYKKILARHLVNTEFNGKVVKDLDVPEAELQKYYDENRERYNAPEKVRLYLIFLEAPAADAAKRKAAKAKAAELHTKLKAAPTDRRLFLELAREQSADKLTSQVGGDTNFKTHDQLVELYGAPVADAGFALKAANDLASVLETDKGLFLLRQAGRQAALDLPLEKVKGQIRTTLFAKARGDAYKAWVDGVKTKSGVQVFDEVLSKAKVDTAGAPGGGLAAPPRELPRPGKPEALKVPAGAIVPAPGGPGAEEPAPAKAP
ncbi:MAG TPA: peptidyl-prolyl cis-trans isomerase, partial [Myxococcota bacterium]|nr:peptidyl-prolyl cis-trans isomerase [Myxococcota bacterium]